jgi:hypothetical protein
MYLLLYQGIRDVGQCLSGLLIVVYVAMFNLPGIIKDHCMVTLASAGRSAGFSRLFKLFAFYPAWDLCQEEMPECHAKYPAPK